MMIRVQEFIGDRHFNGIEMTGQEIDTYINDFLKSHPDIEVVDIKYSSISPRNGYDYSSALLIYKK